jgi:hypothetical protein
VDGRPRFYFAIHSVEGEGVSLWSKILRKAQAEFNNEEYSSSDEIDEIGNAVELEQSKGAKREEQAKDLYGWIMNELRSGRRPTTTNARKMKSDDRHLRFQVKDEKHFLFSSSINHSFSLSLLLTLFVFVPPSFFLRRSAGVPSALWRRLAVEKHFDESLE